MSVNGTGPAASAEVAATRGASKATAPAAPGKAKSWHVSLLSGESAMVGWYPGSDVKHQNLGATQGAPSGCPGVNPALSRARFEG